MTNNMMPMQRNRNRMRTVGFNNLYDMVDDFFRDSSVFDRNLMMDTFKLDVKETDQAYGIEAELPGIAKEEVSLDLVENRLTISVNREEQKDEEKENYIHRERKTSSMSRSVCLRDADMEKATAKLENGILEVRIPKIEEAEKKKRIEIE
ncbi:MAG: Hsp20/alpha crystallin family protein [Peptoniphilaceae bacterium]|jgi:HSP20 family protein|nr:Hsp20/alpha crystallin family protein [Bacillota bacterium]